MKLFYAQTSPFVRKVLVTARELGLAGDIHFEPVSSSPINPHPTLAAANPLVKLPTLVLDDGTALYDSRVIAEYLDAQAGSTLFPPNGPARWAALRRQALADGLMESAVLIRYELGLREERLRSQGWIDGQFIKIRAALDALEAESDDLGPVLTIAEIAVGCALGYLDFRFPVEEWRRGRGGLAAFYAGFGERASMVATRPPAE